MNNGNAIIRHWLEQAVRIMEEQAPRLNQLDRAIGDGDHGTNMLRGFRAALEAVVAEDSPAQNIKNLGMALVSNIGGASGPLYGTFFLRAGKEWQEPMTVEALARASRLGLAGIVTRGRAAVGDATMVDALTPAIESLEQSAARGLGVREALAAAGAAARAGAAATAAMVSRRGRAAAFGQASVGHVDPGAESTALLFNIVPDPDR